MRVSNTILFVLSWFLLAVACNKQERPEAVPVPVPEKEDEGKTATKLLKVMSFNILIDNGRTGDARWSVRREACARMIKDCKPDLVGLQECQQEQFLSFLQLLDGYSGIYIPSMLKNFGTSLLYRTDTFLKERQGYRWYTSTPSSPGAPWPDICDDPSYRTYTWGDLRLKGTDAVVYLYSTHYPRNMTEVTATSDNAAARKRCSEALSAHIREHCDADAPVFACGDYNCALKTEDGRQSMAPMDAWLDNARDAVPADKCDNIRSANGMGAMVKDGKASIDMIWLRNAEALEYKTVTDGYGLSYISDHYPVLLTCRITYKVKDSELSSGLESFSNE